MLLATLRCQAWRRPSPGHSIQFLFAPKFRSFSRPSRSLLQEVKAPGVPPLKDAAGLSRGSGPSFYEKVGSPGIARQIFFVGIASYFTFSLAASITTVQTETIVERMVEASPIWAVKTITNADIKRVQNANLIQNLREKLASFQSTVQHLPVLLQPWVNRACIAVMQPWADASEAKRLCWKICMLNFAVWSAWKVKSWRGFMNKRFMHDPLSGKSYTLLTSAFSHQSFIHLLCNCLALESFGAAAYYYLLREQNKAEPEILEKTSSFHFLAFFMTAAMFSGLVSHIVNAKILFPRVVRQLAALKPKTETWAAAVATTTNAAKEVPKKKIIEILPSLGASGGIYAAVTMTALAFPDSQVALFIPPSYPINIQVGVGGLLLMDTIGILRGWRFFDHWAHLGGAAFGVFYYAYGPSYWLDLRKRAAKAAKQIDPAVS
ncbi:hypothetical protein BDN70DRAFT_852962 [Pholiota conissans]|uniref:Peptidase S54 rhomboid domain-containing protein n=1 Tax=Pholiota conissans TaxID=109636 RepID=A0A9P6D3M5_9AGAR|nr:hypothetical protein BDN70DRAFT_852962 [Pholiota conissans]